jgi:hypothetical protein
MDGLGRKAGKLTLPHEPHDLVEPSIEEPHLGQVEWAFATGVVEDCILAVCVVVGWEEVQRCVADGCGGFGGARWG